MLFAFYIPNHSSQTLVKRHPTVLARLPVRPDFPTKNEMLKWAHDESTNHCFYNLAQPKDESRRLNTKDNPVTHLHGVVADYDSKITPQLLGEAMRKSSIDFPLAYTSRTFSGGARLLWVFEKPIAVINGDMAKALLKRLAKEMKLNKLLPGFDEGAFLDPARYFELGTDWAPVNPDGMIPANALNRFLFEAGTKIDFSTQGPEIPIEEIAAEVERRWPGRWAGPFAVGSLGVRFWDASATNPSGAWIRETGVVAFTGEGRFLRWEEILGREFVERFEADRIGSAIADAYYDGKAYWLKNARGRWEDYTTELLRNYLRMKGLSSADRRGVMSEVDRAINHISFNCRIAGGFPRLFHEGDTYEVGGETYLNISRVVAKAPADGAHTWGQEFPFISQYLSGLFQEGQLDVFLSWHKIFWWSGYRHQLSKGHALFIVGPPGIGKTLLNFRIIGASVGGHQEATAHLTGKSEYNHSLFSTALWSIDDAVALTDRRSHDTYSQTVKKIIANPTMTYRRMYANPITAEWIGRIVVTLNQDPVSIGMLPSSDGSILDKMIFVLASDPKVDFRDAEKKIAAELPHYLAFLRDYKIPAHLTDQPEAVRFGMNAWKHPELLREAKNASGSSEFADVLQLWKTQYFRTNDTETEWNGCATDLMLEFENTDGVKNVIRSQVRSPNALSRSLNQLVADGSYGVSVATTHTKKGRIFCIKK